MNINVYTLAQLLKFPRLSLKLKRKGSEPLGYPFAQTP